jgi:hypothetical protein
MAVETKPTTKTNQGSSKGSSNNNLHTTHLPNHNSNSNILTRLFNTTNLLSSMATKLRTTIAIQIPTSSHKQLLQTTGLDSE